MFTCRLTKAQLRALIAHASRDETRPHVNCILLDPVARCAVATDCHRLAILESIRFDGDGSAALLSVESAELACKAATRKGDTIDLVIATRTGGRAEIRDANDRERATVAVTCFDAEFPPYRQVIPDLDGESRGAPFGVDARYLADVALVQTAAERGGVEVYAAGDSMEGILFRAGPWTVVIMPRRLEPGALIARKEVARAA
jgi:hypothetical protein